MLDLLRESGLECPTAEEKPMKRVLMIAAFCLLTLAGARAQSEAQALVDRSTLALQEMMTQTISVEPHRALESARAVMICPQVFRAGFFFGGEGGGCVLVARGAQNTWSYPAFYGMGGASFGLQIGIQDSQFIMMIMTERGLRSVLDNQFKLGADASIAVATFGGGVQGSTTADLGADIVAFSAARGLYGGISLAGSLMGVRSDWNQAYYNSPIGSREIVVGMQGMNPGADPLREMLTRYGASGPEAAPPQTDAPPQPPTAAPTGAVQQQSLPPPPRG
jgi:lipid-binding SYLF domain-containing protein